MPELPEVETIRSSLRVIEGKRISSIQFSKLAPIETTQPQAILRTLKNSILKKLERRGKYLLFKNQEDHSLVLHLGMSGQLRYQKEDSQENDHHIHMRIGFEDGSILIFRDPRRFGTLSLTKEPNGKDNLFLTRLGPDYLSPELSEELFIQRCRKHPGLNLKALTLHQGISAGLGNIYACESLYRAKLDPRKKVAKTKDHRLIDLLTAAREVLLLGIEHGGSSLRDYFDGLGNRGVMKNFLQVYDREGELTLDGKGKVKRIVQQGRSTFFAPEVQK